MATRMDKYQTEQNKISSRSEKNSHLYQELYTNKVYTEFTNVENNVIDLEDIKQTRISNKRENYHRNKFFLNEQENYNDSHDCNEEKQKTSLEEKNYDINDILENAKKNRKELDEEEKKRHIKTVEYNILSDLSQEKIKEQEKNKKLTKDEEENLEELIHTITSNSLRKKIDDELLGDLLPTEDSETIISKELLDEIEKNEEYNGKNDENIEDEEDSIYDQIDKTFYTKSMDLSEEDFEFEEDKSFLEDNKIGTKILIFLLIIVVMSVLGYIIYRFI